MSKTCLKLIDHPAIADWSELKRNMWTCECHTLLRIEEEIEESDMDYNLLCKHMNLIAAWIKSWDELQRIEMTMQ